MGKQKWLAGGIAAAALTLIIASLFWIGGGALKSSAEYKDGTGLDLQTSQPSTPTPATVEVTPEASRLETPPEPSPTPIPVELVAYKGPVEHIFFHPLIVYPELAFDGDRMSQGYDDWFNTVPEFKEILSQLYKNDYILVDIISLYEEKEAETGTVASLHTLMLPEGKKPLVISVDDLNYYEYMIQNGNASKLVLDDEGKIAALSVTPQGETVISRGDELVPILDDFVEEHPDFSFQGAKGVLALTGYEGILGYRTQNRDAPEYESEVKAALEIVEKLKETGWRFASHSWGHPDAVKADMARMEKDTARWKDEVEPLVGSTPVYIYPYGSRLKHNDPKFQLLTDAGFRFFCGVGPAPYLKTDQSVIEMDRRHIDGMALRTQGERLAPLFDAESVLDPRRP